MTLVTRSATIQVRVAPIVKKASEEVLWGIGLNMSEAVELFLRRIIVDQRIPFDVVAIDPAKLERELTNHRIVEDQTANIDWEGETQSKKSKKVFRRPSSPRHFRARNERKSR